MAKQLSKKLMNLLSEFIVRELGAKVLQGVTYSFFTKDDAESEELYNHYMKIKDEAISCGFSSDEVIRSYTVSNGYIIDVDLKYAKEVLIEVSKAIAVANGEETYVDRVGQKPEERRQSDFKHMAKFLKKSFDEGNLEVEVVLFSKVCANRTAVTGVGPRGETIMVRYNAYALRVEDIEAMNELMLIPAGFRVSTVQACEILPNSQGCVFILRMKEV